MIVARNDQMRLQLLHSERNVLLSRLKQAESNDNHVWVNNEAHLSDMNARIEAINEELKKQADAIH